jgi:hypothetical protein
MKKWHAVALILVGAAVLGSTVFREPIATAAQSVSATIAGPLDSEGNVKVHEQGTALVRDADNPASHPFQAQGNAELADGVNSELFELAQVPAGKRLVIEYVSATSVVPAGQRIVDFLVIVRQGNVGMGHAVPIQFQGSAGVTDWLAAGEPTRLYADAGTTVRAFLLRTDTSGQANVMVRISGYLVDA